MTIPAACIIAVSVCAAIGCVIGSSLYLRQRTDERRRRNAERLVIGGTIS